MLYLLTALGVNLHKSMEYLLVTDRKRTAISSVACVCVRSGARDLLDESV